MKTTYHLTMASGNRKTGFMPVSTTSKNTCPDSCPLKGNGCYAAQGCLRYHWDKVDRGERGGNINHFVKQVAQIPPNTLWRHAQAGDICGANEKIDFNELKKIVAANKGKRGFGYSHKDCLNNKENAKAIKYSNENGFTVNLSANNLNHADQLAKLKIAPVVVLLPMDSGNTTTPQGRKVVVCPAQTKGITCSFCGLCAKRDRNFLIGFKGHGVMAKKVGEMAKGK